MFFAEPIINFGRIIFDENQDTLSSWSGSAIVLSKVLRALKHPVWGLENSFHVKVVLSFLRFLLLLFMTFCYPLA